MRLLILSHNYSPEVVGIGPYTTELAEHFARGGHSVTVLTTFPHYPRYRWHRRPRFLGRERRSGVLIRRMRVVLPRRSTAFWRIVFDTSVGLEALLNSIGVARPDVTISVIPTLQTGLVGGLLARLWSARSILLVKDLPLEAGLAVGMLKQGFLYRAGTRFEHLVYHMGDRIVVIGEQFASSLTAKGIDAERIAVIPDWVDTQRVRPEPADPDVRRLLAGSDNGFLAVHTGTMGAKQGLRTLVEASREWASDSSIRTALVGDGPNRSVLEAAIAEYQLENIRLIGIQPVERFPKILAAADVLLLNQRADVIDAVVPSKLLSYMAAGRPVVASVNQASVAATLVRDAGCGIVVPPEDPARLADAVRELKNNPRLRLQLGQTGRDYAEKRFSKDTVLALWDQLLLEVDSARSNNQGVG